MNKSTNNLFYHLHKISVKGKCTSKENGTKVTVLMMLPIPETIFH